MKTLLRVFLLVAVLQSCKKDAEVTPSTANPDTVTPQTEVTDTLESPPAVQQTKIERIDSLAYYTAKANVPAQKNAFRKVTDLEEARTMLKGTVVFGKYDQSTYKLVESNTGFIIKEIIPRQGTPRNVDGEAGFVAYYPDLDILLCEGGHTTDVSYNLANGDETYDTGNPDLIVASADGTMQFNGAYGGQECFYYFIQRREKEGFKKIFELTETINKQFGSFSLCSAHDAFWQGNNVLYIFDRENFIDRKEGTKAGPVYFRVTLGK